MNVQKQQKLQK